MFLFEKPEAGAVCSAWLPILYAGVFSCGIGYTLQVIGQKEMDPTVASLILSLESVISVLAGWVLLGQRLAGREILGCVVECLQPLSWLSFRTKVMRKSLSRKGTGFLTSLRKKQRKKLKNILDFLADL